MSATAVLPIGEGHDVLKWTRKIIRQGVKEAGNKYSADEVRKAMQISVRRLKTLLREFTSAEAVRIIVRNDGVHCMFESPSHPTSEVFLYRKS